MLLHKVKYIISLLIASAVFNIHASDDLASQTELTHEQKVAQIAAPLYAKIGIHKGWLEDSLLKTSDNSLRDIKDVTDIVERFLKLYPTLLTELENNTDNLKTKKAKREMTAYTIARAISGLANVPASERDALPEQARSIITDQSSMTRIASAMDELASIKKPEKRLQLVETLTSSTFTDEQRLNFAGAVSEIPGDVNYAEVIRLLPIATQELDFDASQDYIYPVIRGLALNATDEGLRALIEKVQEFVVASNQSIYDKIRAFELIGQIPAELRNDFISIADELSNKFGQPNPNSQLNALNGLVGYENIEDVKAFLSRIDPIMHSNPGLIQEAFTVSYRSCDPTARDQIINLVSRLDALSNAEDDSNDTSQPEFMMFPGSVHTLCYRSTEERETLVTAIENVSTKENLNKIQRNTLLIMLGRVARSRADIETALQALKNFSWQGNPTPSFKEQLTFTSSFFSSFAYLPFSDRNSKVFASILESANRHLTPELVQKHQGFYRYGSSYGFDFEEPSILIDAVFQSSVYDNLDVILQTATSQFSRLNDANIEITDTEKANLILAVATINPAEREAKTKQADKLVKQSYFAQFMQNLTASQQ